MPAGDDVDEGGECLDDGAHRLPFDRLGVENDEVNRMAFEQCHADLGVALEAADSGAVPGARVDHHDRRRALAHVLLERIGATARDPQQPVVGRCREVVPIGHRLGLEVQQWWHARCLVRRHVGRAFAQRVSGRCSTPDRVQPVAGEKRIRQKAQPV